MLHRRLVLDLGTRPLAEPKSLERKNKSIQNLAELPMAL
jgi:hypothetical protein